MIKCYDFHPEFVCTRDNRWNHETLGKVRHPDAVYIKDRDHGDGVVTAVYECPWCLKTFEVELAQ